MCIVSSLKFRGQSECFIINSSYKEYRRRRKVLLMTQRPEIRTSLAISGRQKCSMKHERSQGPEHTFRQDLPSVALKGAVNTLPIKPPMSVPIVLPIFG